MHAGKMLGGSSNLNAMFYYRGNRKNYDDWQAQGARGWSYNDVFPYFLKLEDNRDFRFLRKGKQIKIVFLCSNICVKTGNNKRIP